MHQLATGPGALGLVGSEPPLSPETIGRAPSSFETAVPLRSLEELVGLTAAAETAPPPAEELPPAALVPAAAPDPRRLVVRLLGGEDLELGIFNGPDEAIARAKQLVGVIAAAEASGEWPELEGRFLRPSSIVSLDVLAVS
jgi:hypothetical protein